MTPARHRVRAALRVAPPLLALPVALLLGACGDARDELRRRFAPPDPRDRYADMLHGSGLAATALGHDWLAAGDRALRAPLAVTLPYREVGYFAPDEAAAVAFRVTPRVGQRLSVRVERAGAAPGALFVELFRVHADSTRPPLRVASADAAGTPELETVAERGAVAYVVRVQPELLRGVRYAITIAAGPSLAFPVAGRDARAVRSFFGAGRDAGRRRHEGVDIFAPRGTPVVAAAPGVVRSVGTNTLGGKVVWLWLPSRGQSLYYAHLDRQLARDAQVVRAGDTLGLVGNTGNAATTSPHLHFGIYRRGFGAVDPFPFIDDRVPAPPRVVADTSALGGWRRVSAGGSAFAGREAAADPDGLLAETPVRVFAASADRYRVRLPDGRIGFVPARRTDRALAGAAPALRTPLLLERPVADAVVIDSLGAPGDSSRAATVLGRWNDFLLVRSGRGRYGWVAAAARPPSRAGRAAGG